MNNILGERDGLRVVFDPNKGYARLDPLPSQDEIDRLYRGSFWADKGDERQVRRMQASWWDLHYGDWLELAQKVAQVKIDSLLDVGCGFGYWMRYGLLQGLDVAGVDPSAYAIQESCAVLGEACGTPVSAEAAVLKISGELGPHTWRVAQTSIVNAPIRKSFEPYRMVSALWVMEHLLNPEQFLMNVRAQLCAGGVFLAAVPSDFNALQLKVVDEGLSARPYWWIDPTHLNYWTPATFAGLLGRHGFRVAALTTMYPMERFVVGGIDYPANPQLGPALHADVRDFDRLTKSRAWRKGFYQRLALSGQGREIIAICVKE